MEIVYVIIPLALIGYFFFTKNAVAGWLAAIFWFVLAAYFYTLSGTPAGGAFDLQMGMMWGSIAGGIACSLYAFSIGKNKDKDDEDEVPDDKPYVDGSIDETDERIKRIHRKRKEKRMMSKINRRG